VHNLVETYLSNFKELNEVIEKRNLLKKQSLFEFFKITLNFVLLAISISILFLFNNIWIQLLNAAFLAVVFTQAGLIGHDSGHQQISKKSWVNNIIGLIHGNLIAGISYNWWVPKHNRHHNSPNVDELDPDVDFPALAFSKEQAIRKEGVSKFITKYQAYFFPFFITLEGLNMKKFTFNHIIKRRKMWAIEAFLVTIHLIFYFGIIFYNLGALHGILFIITNQLLFGFYLSSIFATNHKGMEIVNKDHSLDFVKLQVSTSRNVKSNVFTDYFYGGLNHQIEHHLFPHMSRNKLNRAQEIVKAFCKKKSIDYEETSMIRSYKEILKHLHDVSSELRKPN
jgi:fatty acid desaturase